uniref:Uncharacterized protein n=1 Tax=Tanacetum cinerariifolium TaxID=118510 RepID=A0A699KDZ1_TANCI|nr:hypothetical protein [Tanacetum cinerariifolium]
MKTYKKKETPSPLKETTTKSTTTRRTKATAARGLHIQNTPPSENPPTTPQTEAMNVQNIRILSPVIQNDSTQTPAVKAVKIKDKIRKNSKTKAAGEKMEVSLPSRSKIKITPKKYGKCFPMGKKKPESDSLRDFNDEFLISFKKQFEDKNEDATDREIFEMCQGRFRLVDVIGENEETKNESEVEKRKLKERELEDILKENMEMHELFYEDEKFELFVKNFKEEFATGLNRDENKAGTSGARHGNDNDDVDYDGHCNDENDVGHANHEDVHANGNDKVDFVEENEANEIRVDAEKSVKEATEEKEANKATKKKEEAKKLATKKKEKAKKLAAAKKKEAAEKSAKRLLKKLQKKQKKK